MSHVCEHKHSIFQSDIGFKTPPKDWHNVRLQNFGTFMKGNFESEGSDGLNGSKVLRGIILMCLQSSVRRTRWRNFRAERESCPPLERCEFEIFQFWRVFRVVVWPGAAHILLLGRAGSAGNLKLLPGRECKLWSKDLEVLEWKHCDVKFCDKQPILLEER